MERTIVDLSEDHPRYGYRRITVLVRRKGELVNAKRVQRVRRHHGLQVRKKQRKMRRTGLSTGRRQRATHANHVWRSEEHTSELQSLMRISYAVSCLKNN